jgi:hypothetical protein
MNIDTDDLGLKLHQLAVQFNLRINVEVNITFHLKKNKFVFRK